jgi:hypothetical protein
MARVFSLLLPALIPSWRFFKAVEPSPRVQWAVDGGAWHDYRPRPDRITLSTVLCRMLWNPHWNDTLYMVSLAERLTLAPDAATLAQIWQRLGTDIAADAGKRVQFRLLFVTRDTSEVTYQSAQRPLAEIIS